MFHILVADGKAVRVYETSPTGDALDELAVFHNRVAKQHERDLVSARPGRVINRAAGIRQSYEPKVSAKQYLTQRWLKLVGVQLQLLLASHGSEAVILVAAPRMLSQLRGCLPPRVRALVHAELARDLVQQPVSVLTKRLQPTVRDAARSVLRSQPVHRRPTTRSSRLPTSVSRT